MNPRWDTGSRRLRVRARNQAGVQSQGAFVLYWMIAARRTSWSFALDRALDWCAALGRPLVVLEALRVDYPWASDRLHRFVLDGMADNAAAFEGTGIGYLPYVEPVQGAGKGLLRALAEQACLVVTDEFPCFFLPTMVRAAARALPVRLETVDGNGLLPLEATGRTFGQAVAYRRHLQRILPEHIDAPPDPDPLARKDRPALAELPAAVRTRWPVSPEALLAGDPGLLAALPIDHEVGVVPLRGGSRAATSRLQRFLGGGLPHYAAEHREPGKESTSRLSPYLHFGHLSVHAIVSSIRTVEQGPPLTRPATGARRGFWGLSESAEAFLDQLVVWRELAYTECAFNPDGYDRYDSLPAWARETLEAHERDPRPHLYTLHELEQARTDDPIWNAAQGELLRQGWFHNSMRMLWGKRILTWSETAQQALDTMIAIMNRWSLDGRNPNSYAGYFWVLGRYDRPWFERPIFGKVRAMTTRSAARKLDLDGYVARYASQPCEPPAVTR